VKKTTLQKIGFVGLESPEASGGIAEERMKSMKSLVLRNSSFHIQIINHVFQ
jgi:hypothetical protein